MRWYLGKIQSCTFALINNFEILQDSIAFFSDTVRPRSLKFFLYINPYGYSLQTKFHDPSVAHFTRKMRWYLKKIQSCTFALINIFEILEVSIVLFSDSVWLRNLKFFLYIDPYGLLFANQISCSSVAILFVQKMRWYLAKIQSCTIVHNKQLWNFTS